MDTPQNNVNQIQTPLTEHKFEEHSSFVDYINDLSPIKALNSFPVPQTLNSLNFVNSPVFTTPHAKSHREFELGEQHVTESELGEEHLRESELREEDVRESELREEHVREYELRVEDVRESGLREEHVRESEVPEEDGRDVLLGEKSSVNLINCRSYHIAGLTSQVFNNADRMDFQKMFKKKSENEDLQSIFSEQPVELLFLDSNSDRDCGTISDLHRGVRKQFLNFENASNESNKLSSRLVPGLHLNAITMHSRDNITSNINDTNDDTEQRQSEIAEEIGEYDQNSSILEELMNQTIIPKKKRHKSEQRGDNKSCKRCNCKKSKCLKLYCECFAAGVFCTEPCSCVDCFNKSTNKETVVSTRKQIESRNPIAFAPKVIMISADTGDDPRTTPASARHKRGCNCKKSGCLKKYCECFQSGVGCSANCRCEGCQNSFGRREDSNLITTSRYLLLDNDNEQDIENENENEMPPIRQPLAVLPYNNRLHPQPSLPYKDASSSRQFNINSFSHSMAERIREERSENVSEITDQVPAENSIVERSDLGSSPWRRNGDGRNLILSIPTFPALTFR